MSYNKELSVMLCVIGITQKQHLPPAIRQGCDYTKFTWVSVILTGEKVVFVLLLCNIL